MEKNTNLLEELKQQKIWLLWRKETRTDSKGEQRPTKVPINAHGARTGTDRNHATEWMTYEEALRAKENVTCAGIGFKIPEGVFFLDIDHRQPEDSFVKELLDRFGSYAERSCSGNGFHIYGKYDPSAIPTVNQKDGRKKLSPAYYLKNPHNGVELYFGDLTNRFAVFTGDCVYHAPLKDCTPALLATLERDMRRTPKAETGERIVHDETSAFRRRLSETCDQETVRILNLLYRQKNGAKFAKLFEEGDFSDYGSQSEADLALCSIIAFRAGNNPELIDRIFRLSRLFREKWEREDYRESTIRLAIEGCGGEPGENVVPAPPFIIQTRQGEEKVSAPLLAQFVRENLHYIMVRSGATEELMMYVYENGVYSRYDEKMFKGVVKGYIEAYDMTLVRASLLNEVYDLLQTDLNYINISELNSRWDLINFQNGLLQIGHGKPVLLPHTPEVYSTIRIPCVWREEAVPTPVFQAYMEMLTDGDAEVQQLLLEYIGAVLSNIPGYRMKKALFLVGEGNTGKSQLKSLVERLIGLDNFMGMDLREIENRFGTGRIYNKRLAGTADLPFMTLNEISTFKKLTGGDSIFAEDKGKQGFEFTYKGMLLFCTNRMPRFGGDNGQWVYERFLPVDCPNVIPPEKQDKLLPEKLYAEREGIVQQAVEALDFVIRNGFTFSEPASVIRSREFYRNENSTVWNFYMDCMCQKSEECRFDEELTVTEVYKAYKEYCRTNNNGYTKTKKEFDHDLSEILGCTPAELTKRKNIGIVYIDYTLTPEARNQYVR